MDGRAHGESEDEMFRLRERQVVGGGENDEFSS